MITYKLLFRSGEDTEVFASRFFVDESGCLLLFDGQEKVFAAYNNYTWMEITEV